MQFSGCQPVPDSIKEKSLNKGVSGKYSNFLSLATTGYNLFPWLILQPQLMLHLSISFFRSHKIMLETLVTLKVSIVLPPNMEPKERILQKAHELFNRYGIRSVSMDEIAAQVGMSKKTLYQYFADKEELVSAVFSRVMMHNREQCTRDRAIAENAIHEVFLAFDMMQEMFAEMNPSVLYDMEKYHPVTFAQFKTYRDGFLFQLISQNLNRGIAEELYRAEVDVDILTRYRLHAMMLAFNPEVFPNNRTHLVHIEQQILEHFLYGLATTKGQKMIQKYKNQRIKK